MGNISSPIAEQCVFIQEQLLSTRIKLTRHLSRVSVGGFGYPGTAVGTGEEEQDCIARSGFARKDSKAKFLMPTRVAGHKSCTLWEKEGMG